MAYLLVAAVSSLSLYAVYKLVRLAFADADLHLLSLGEAPAKAFQGKVVWITGASQGLGAVLAQHFASRGAKLILSSRSANKLETVKKSCSARPEDVMVLPFDLCGPYSELEAAAAAADQAFGGIGVDFVVHNAGASQHSLAEETSASVTDQMFALNTLGPIKLTRAILPRLLARGKGRIVVVGSMSSKLPSPGQAVYAGCKMALYGYFSTLATEIAHTNVGVTICCPGPIATGSDEAPRVIYGAEGLIKHNNTGGSNRMKPERTAQLIANAAAHGVDECWIAKHPVLGIGYIFQLVPLLGWRILKKVGPKRAAAIKAGKSGYDIRNMVGGGAGK